MKMIDHDTLKELFTLEDLLKGFLSLFHSRGAGEAAIVLPPDLGPSGMLRNGRVELVPEPSLLPPARGLIALPLTFESLVLGTCHLPQEVADNLEEEINLLALYLHRHTLEHLIASKLGRDVILEGRASCIHTIYTLVERYGSLRDPILIRGESGVGKDLIAMACHVRSLYVDGPFVSFDCSIFSNPTMQLDNLIGSSPEDGASIEGKAPLANTGTLYISEVSDLSLEAQSALLHILETGEIVFRDNKRTMALSIRVIVSTEEDLESMVQKGKFRRDLYFTLCAFEIPIPSLRDHPDDIPILAETILYRFAKENKIPYKRLTPESMEKLTDYEFPGNIHELKVTLKRALVHAKGKLIRPEDLVFPSCTLEEDKADRVFRQIVEERHSFWDVVKDPFLKRELSKEDLWVIVDQGLNQCGGKYKDLLTLFNLPSKDYARFISFLNRNSR